MISSASIPARRLCALSGTVRTLYPPAAVQNRCYARTGWDREVREFCAQNSMVYQGFSLLTANREELAQPAVRALATRRGQSVAELVFSFARQVGMLPLTGTSSPSHMRLDLAAVERSLAPADVTLLESIGAP